MGKKCLHCGKELGNEKVSYCESCFNELRTKGMFTTKKEKNIKEVVMYYKDKVSEKFINNIQNYKGEIKIWTDTAKFVVKN